MGVLNALPAIRDRFPDLGRQTNAFRLAASPASAPDADPAVRRLFATDAALRALPEPDRQELMRWARIRFFKRQTGICRQGDPAGHVIFALEGYLKLSALLADGSEVFLELVGPGRGVSELLVLQAGQQQAVHDANVTSLSPCRVLMIDARPFRQILARRPDALLSMLRRALERHQGVAEQLVDSRARPAPARLAKALLLLARLPASESQSRCGDVSCLKLRLSQGELALMAGMSREFANKYLGFWRDAGWIGMSGGTVATIDAAALTELVDDVAVAAARTVVALAGPARRGTPPASGWQGRRSGGGAAVLGACHPA